MLDVEIENVLTNIQVYWVKNLKVVVSALN